MQTDFPARWGNRLHFEQRDGYWWCILCHKWSSDEYIQSRKHQKKVEWEEWLPEESGGRQIADFDSSSIPELSLEVMYAPRDALFPFSKLADVSYPPEKCRQSDALTLRSLTDGCTLQQARPQQKKGRNKICTEKYASEARFADFASESPPAQWCLNMESTRSQGEPKAPPMLSIVNLPPPPPPTSANCSSVVAHQTTKPFISESPSLALFKAIPLGGICSRLSICSHVLRWQSFNHDLRSCSL